MARDASDQAQHGTDRGARCDRATGHDPCGAPRTARTEPALRPSEFAGAARVLAVAAARRGLVAPSFRTPPVRADQRRTLRRYGDGSVMVSVRLAGRGAVDVLDDLVDGVIAVNRARGLAGARLRVEFWEALAAAGFDEPARVGAPPGAGVPPGVSAAPVVAVVGPDVLAA